MIRLGSMFSGAGGLDLAVAEVFGATHAWVADVCGEPDPKKRTPKNWPHRTPHGAPCTILAHRFPDVPNLGDVTAIDFTTVEPVDIIAAGFPCTDMSVAGKRAGLRDGTRSGLWSEVVRAIDTLRPRMVVLENVPGIFTASAAGDVEPCPGCVGDGSGGDMRALDAVLGDLATLGFDAEWLCIPASDVGAPHKRERWFSVAYPAGDRWDEGWPESAGIVGRPDAAVRGHTDVTLLKTPTSQLAANGGSQHPAKRREGGHGPTLADEVEHLLLPSAGADRFGEYAPAISRWETVLGRPVPDPTEPTGKGGAHRLSPEFASWMMGWPDGWVTDVPGITRNEALKACGNGVVTLQAIHALRTLLTRTESETHA